MFRRLCFPAAAATAVATGAAAHTLRSSSRSCAVTLGSSSRGEMPPVRVSWTDLAGDENQGPSARLAAGRVLSMMDMCAARTADMVVTHVKRPNEKFLTCTVGVTNTTFSCPILQGDAIRMDSRIIHCGASSVGIYIRFFRQSPSTRTETPAGESFFTMVTITPDLKAAKIVPSMTLTDPFDIAMHNRYLYIRQIQKENVCDTKKQASEVLVPSDVTCSINDSKPVKVTFESTKCQANRIFFTAFLNNNNTVFGGELMAWMERHATQCGRMLTGNRHVYTLGMHSVSFNEPVFATDWVTLGASVIYIRNTTMEVDVTLVAERRDTGALITNRASFVLINSDDIGHKQAINVGLDLEKASQEDLHRYLEAKTRYHRSVERKGQFEKAFSATYTA